MTIRPHDGKRTDIEKMDGTPVDPAGDADVTITIITQEVQPAGSDHEFPSLSNFQQLDHITRGKAGGCK